MTRCEHWFHFAIAFGCGYIAALLSIVLCIALEPMDRRVRSKALMLQAMNYADDDARWRMKQMAQSVKTSPLQAIQEIEMYERIGAFPAERPPAAQQATTLPAIPTGPAPVNP